METFANACYPEHGLPLLLYLARNYNLDMQATLCANADAEGITYTAGWF